MTQRKVFWLWYMPLICILLFGVSACSDFDAGFRLWQANQHYRAGRSHEALVGYLSLYGSAASNQAEYNIATIYLSLGESEAASRLLQRVAAHADKSLASRALHNLGTLYFRQTAYDQALEAYGASLRLLPGRAPSIAAYEATWEQLKKNQASSSDRERAAMQAGAGDSFGLFTLSTTSAKDLFKSGGFDDDASVLDH
jgi:tetratricopeptide (TPR) repeat protein